MANLRTVRAFVLRLLQAARLTHQAGADFDAELQSHIAMGVEDGIRAGLSAEEARRVALLRVGGAEQTRQAYRERQGLPSLEGFVRDSRYALRSLKKHPVITAVAVISIGLGMGANATAFSLLSRFLLRPAPVGDPSTLLSVSTVHKGDRCCNHLSWPVFDDVQAQSTSFSAMAAYFDLVPASIRGDGEPERVWGQAVTPNFFSVLEMPMVLGRGFVPEEKSAPVVVLNELLWRRKFAADPLIVGKSVELSGRSYTVVGVAPAAFRSVDQILDTRFWVPLESAKELLASPPPEGSRDYHWLSVVGRLRPGATEREADAELGTLSSRFAATYPATDKDDSFHTEIAGTLPPNLKSTIALFLCGLVVVSILVLSIAGANVANLLLAQAMVRQREMAVRLALGSTRARMRRQMLMESTILALGGAALGIALSYLGTQALSQVRLPAPVPLDLQVAPDWRVLGFSFVLSVVCGVLLGAGPAWAASRPNLVSALRGEDALARSGRRISTRNLLVVGQTAISVILLSITVLFLRSLEGASRIDIGIRSKGLLLLSVDPRVHGYSPERTVAFLAQLESKAAALPGVVSVAVTDVAPLSGGNRSDGFTVTGTDVKDSAMIFADLYMASPSYLETIGTPLLQGRNFGAESPTGPKVAMINQAFADRLFPSVNPIGQHVSGGGRTFEIVGVAGNAKSRTLGEDTRPMLYRSLRQSVADDPSERGYTLVVRSDAGAMELSQALRRQVYELDPAMAIFNEQTIEEHVHAAFFLPRVAAILFGIFGGVGVLLAAIGLYGVMSYSVTRRTREIGIRMAMGAQVSAVERLVLGHGLLLVTVALLLGWPCAWLLSKLASSFLYGIEPHDVFTFTVVPLFLLIIALLSCWIPARRAATIDPMQALRSE